MVCVSGCRADLCVIRRAESSSASPSHHVARRYVGIDIRRAGGVEFIIVADASCAPICANAHTVWTFATAFRAVSYESVYCLTKLIGSRWSACLLPGRLIGLIFTGQPLEIEGNEALAQNTALERFPLDMGHFVYPACRK